MYQITRKNRIKETLQLCNADGSVAEEINVDLNVDAIAGRMNKAYEALAHTGDARLSDAYVDKAVMQAYGFKPDMPESDIATELMKMYQKLTEKE